MEVNGTMTTDVEIVEPERLMDPFVFSFLENVLRFGMMDTYRRH